MGACGNTMIGVGLCNHDHAEAWSKCVTNGFEAFWRAKMIIRKAQTHQRYAINGSPLGASELNVGHGDEGLRTHRNLLVLERDGFHSPNYSYSQPMLPGLFSARQAPAIPDQATHQGSGCPRWK